MTFQWQLPALTPPRKRLQPYEWDVLLGLAGGLTFDEIADETGLSHLEIRQAVEVLIEVRFIRLGRGWYRNRITDIGRWAIGEERARRERRHEIAEQTCPRCGKTGCLPWRRPQGGQGGGCPDAECLIAAIHEQAQEHVRTRLPPAGTPLNQLTLFQEERQRTMDIPDEIPTIYKDFQIEIVQGARGEQDGAEAIRRRDHRHITTAAVYHSPLAVWIMLRHLIDVTRVAQVDERIQVLLSALCLAADVVRQHNLLSTASTEDRLAILQRHTDWWNCVAIPAIESILGPGTRQELLDEARKAVVQVPNFLAVPPWLQQAAAPDLKDGQA